MKLEIANGPKPKPEKVVRVGLFESSDGISLATVRDDGAPNWYLLSLTKDGVIVRHGSLTPELGFKTDSKGRIETI